MANQHSISHINNNPTFHIPHPWLTTNANTHMATVSSTAIENVPSALSICNHIKPHTIRSFRPSSAQAHTHTYTCRGPGVGDNEGSSEHTAPTTGITNSSSSNTLQAKLNYRCQQHSACTHQCIHTIAQPRLSPRPFFACVDCGVDLDMNPWIFKIENDCHFSRTALL